MLRDGRRCCQDSGGGDGGTELHDNDGERARMAPQPTPARSGRRRCALARRRPEHVAEDFEPHAGRDLVRDPRRQRPNTTSIPLRTNSRVRSGSVPTRSVSTSRLSATICDTLATESLGSPVVAASSRTFPGAPVQRTLLVRGTQTTVAIRLRLNASHWTTTGRLNPGSDPVCSPRSAQHTSPCVITTGPVRAPSARPAS